MPQLPKALGESGPYSLREMARKINELRAYCATLRIGPSPTVRRRHTGGGTVLEVTPGVNGGRGNTVIAAIITAILQNTLKVKEYDYEAARAVGDEFEVALPVPLRGHNEQKRTKPGTSNGIPVSEEQQITPKYQVDDIILIEEVPARYLGLFDQSGEAVTWTDRNEAGRAWAALAATFETESE